MKSGFLFRFLLLGLFGAMIVSVLPYEAAAQKEVAPPPKPPAQQKATPPQPPPARQKVIPPHPPPTPAQQEVTPPQPPPPPAQRELAPPPSPPPPAKMKSSLHYFNQGGEKLDQGLLDKAIADYTEAIKLRPNFYLAYLNRGTALRRKGEFDQAITDYTKVIKMKPNFYDAYTLRGICYGKKGLYQKAVADYTKALKKKPHYLTYNGLAWIFATSKNPKYRNGPQAVKLAQEAVMINRNPKSLSTLAAALAESGKFPEAVQAQEEAIKLVKRPGPIPQKVLAPYKRHLQAYQNNKPWRE